MAVRYVSVALDEAVAASASAAAERRGVTLSAWLNAAAERALLVDTGLAAVAAWEADHGPLARDELALADMVLDGVGRPVGD